MPFTDFHCCVIQTKKKGSFCSSENIIFLMDLAQLQSGWPFEVYTKKEIPKFYTLWI